MSKILSTRERKRRELLKRYKSLENKMHGTNLIWWNSLSMEARYSLLFKWILQDPKKLSHFLKKYKKLYKSTTINYRNALIEHIIK